ncbi:MAG: GtrA family protein [Candidatus Komeilibacteria bacterium]|nr:GtrA family protein [Candidatus Komeilibacteria bacterium]
MIDKIFNNSALPKGLILRVLNRYFFRFPVLKQFIKFSLVGVVNTLIDFSIFFILTRTSPWFKANYLAANAIGFSLAVTNSFWLNKKWTFQDRNKTKLTRQYLKFFGLNFMILIITEICLYYLIQHLNVYDLLAKVLIVLISVIINFFISRSFIFPSMTPSG